MANFRFLTAGESHGPALSVIIEGLPSGLQIESKDIGFHLARRQKGYGRGARMKIETDTADILGGVRHGYTTGAPVSLQIINKDYAKWLNPMNPAPIDINNPEIQTELADKYLSKVRPGHADFAGAIKYNHDDVRNILERASARETTSRVAVGAVALKFLENFGVKIHSHVIRIGSVALDKSEIGSLSEEDIKNIENDEMRCKNSQKSTEMKAEIDRIRANGDTVGGVVEIIIKNVPIGIGSHVHWDRRLDGILGMAMLSIHAVKGVAVGLGFGVGEYPGSQVHDEIQRCENYNSVSHYKHLTNRAGGIEGGISNGEDIVLHVAFKPIPTLARAEDKALKSINLKNKSNDLAFYERSDVCIVPAGGVICEAMAGIVFADQFLQKFGGDSIQEMQKNYKAYIDYCLER